MKKNYLTGAVLPVLAAAAIVGSGFSIWFFNDAETSTKQDLSVNVTQKIAVGSFSSTDTSFKLVFDQTTEGRKLAMNNSASADSLKLTADGIYLVTDADEKFSEGTHTVTYTETEGAYNTGDNVKLTITTTVTVDTAVAATFDIAYGDKTLDKKMSANGSKYTYTFEWAEDQKEFDWNQVEFTYAEVTGNNPYNVTLGEGYNGYVRTGAKGESAEPINAQEYAAFFATVNGKAISVEHKAVLSAQ